MTYEIRLGPPAHEYLQNLDPKSRHIVRENLGKLEDDPFPRHGSGLGDVEKVTVEGKEFYRIHIGRTHTAFYRIDEENMKVNVADITDIDKARRMYD
ncbi:MAG: type II toxin-antitoxin system RelE/ParE family toxin [Candidatus Nanohaloarchaeota archaeon QJJ-7]|nr:type II toxin-antitoxin system RelE/ParE family toxin [Candidatus Nanohaloarchaeota archaeon QJJ-7]